MTAVAWLDEYKALTAGAGLVDFPEWTQIELRGKDRASFLHNLCTNEIRKLPADGGCEAFLVARRAVPPASRPSRCIRICAASCAVRASAIALSNASRASASRPSSLSNAPRTPKK